jgi:hypothetical protein
VCCVTVMPILYKISILSRSRYASWVIETRE